MASRAFDTFITYKIISNLVTDWEDFDAFEQGIIDKKGKLLRKYNTLKTSEEKSAYTLFHRLIFNLKRLIQKLPGGSSKLASYAAGLFLIKEEIDVERLLNEGEAYVEELLQD
tara:strand:+ start:347 stop:685 length:339 start_codon:yes stop_codon:yes gene_type:complete